MHSQNWFSQTGLKQCEHNVLGLKIIFNKSNLKIDLPNVSG